MCFSSVLFCVLCWCWLLCRIKIYIYNFAHFWLTVYSQRSISLYHWVDILDQTFRMPPLCRGVQRITVTLFERLTKNFYRATGLHASPPELCKHVRECLDVCSWLPVQLSERLFITGRWNVTPHTTNYNVVVAVHGLSIVGWSIIWESVVMFIICLSVVPVPIRNLS